MKNTRPGGWVWCASVVEGWSQPMRVCVSIFLLSEQSEQFSDQNESSRRKTEKR